jgi:hypothetical protein
MFLPLESHHIEQSNSLAMSKPRKPRRMWIRHYPTGKGCRWLAFSKKPVKASWDERPPAQPVLVIDLSPESVEAMAVKTAYAIRQEID